MREQRAKLSRGNDVAKAMDYMLKRWPAFVRFLDDGRICLSNNAAERALRGIALGRKSWLFAGSDRGGQRAAAMYSIIVTAKMNDVDPQAWLDRRPGPHCRAPGPPARRTPAVELATFANTCPSGRLTLPAISPSSPSTTSPKCSARMRNGCGNSNGHVRDDGCLRVYGVGEDGVPAFTDYGIECLKQIIADERAAGRAPPPSSPQSSIAAVFTAC